MKQMVGLPQQMACDNCSGRTRLEFDRLDVGLPGRRMVLHLTSVPYFQCRECDHRQMPEQAKERLDAGIDPFLAGVDPAKEELFVRLNWTELLSLEHGEGHDRLYEVEWVLEDW